MPSFVEHSGTGASTVADTAQVVEAGFEDALLDFENEQLPPEPEPIPLPLHGSMDALEARDVAALAGSAEQPQGLLAALEANDVAALAGTVLVQGAMAADGAIDLFAASGAIISPGSLAAFETPDTMAFTGTVRIQGALAGSDPPDTILAGGAVSNQPGSLVAFETTDIMAFAGTVLIAGALAALEGQSDTAALAGTVLVQGTAAATEAADIFVAGGSVSEPGSLTAFETADTMACAGTVLVAGALAATGPFDIFAMTGGTVIVRGSLVVTEAQDVCAAQGDVFVQGALAATDTTDVAAITGSLAGQPDEPFSGDSTLVTADETDEKADEVPAGALPTFAGAGATTFSTTLVGTHAIAYPLGVQLGDWLLVPAVGRNTNADVTLAMHAAMSADGWLHITGSPFAPGTTRGLLLAWKIADADDVAASAAAPPGNNIAGGIVGNSTTPATTNFLAHCERWVGVNGASPFESITNITKAFNTAITAPTVTPSALNRRAVAIFGGNAAPALFTYTGATGGTWGNLVHITGTVSVINTASAALPSGTPITGGGATLSVNASGPVVGFALKGP